MFNLGYLNFKTDTFFYDSKSYNNIHDDRWCKSFKLHLYSVSWIITSGVENLPAFYSNLTFWKHNRAMKFNEALFLKPQKYNYWIFVCF